MDPLLSYYGNCSRTRLILTLLIIFILSVNTYTIFSDFLTPKLFFSLTALTLLPVLISRIREGGLKWYWLPLAFISIVPLLAALIVTASIEKLFNLEVTTPQSLSIAIVFILAFSLITTIIFWLMLGRNHFFRMLLITTPFTAPFWLLYQLFIKKPDQAAIDGDINRLTIPYKKICFTLNGRLSREEFWLYSIIPWGILSLIISSFDIFRNDYTSHIPWLYEIVLVTSSLVGLVFSFSIFVKRLHDLNKSAWWLFLLFIPVIGALYLFIISTFKRGDCEKNGFGNPIDNSKIQSTYNNINIRIKEITQRAWFKRFIIISSVSITALFLSLNYSVIISNSYPYSEDFYFNFKTIFFAAKSYFFYFETVFIIALMFLAINHLKRGIQIKLGLAGLSLVVILYNLFNASDSYRSMPNLFQEAHLIIVLYISVSLLLIGFLNNKSYLFTIGLVFTFEPTYWLLMSLEQYITYGEYWYGNVHYYIASLQTGVFLMLFYRSINKVNESQIEYKKLMNITI
jgi:uncharacterized membrane protein YhaH (DUF805 family)